MINNYIARSLHLLPKPFIWLFSKKYIAGENIEDALRVCRELNRSGFMVTVDLLGENITNLGEAEKYKQQYIGLIKRYISEKINGNFSIKPSMFGLKLEKEICLQNLRQIVHVAKQYNTFIRIDMEDSSCTSDEIDIFKKLKNEFPENVGLVLQSYLRRTSEDLKELYNLHSSESTLNIRICKGIYIERAEISFKNFQGIRNHFIEDLDFMLKNGIYAAIATHDKYLIDRAEELIEHYKTPKEMYEFQMLYGVTPLLGKSILNRGHRMRIYVPYGMEWLNYSIRRLNENPHIIRHIVKALFVRQ